MPHLLASLWLSLAVVGAAAAQDVFVNELHYDNDGTDSGEAIEIAGPAGTELEGWSIVLYDGESGAPHTTIGLSGVLPDQHAGFGTATVVLPVDRLPNHAPHGLALVDASGSVVQFLSYEGSFAAVGGPADGLTSTDIGVAETSSTPADHSLQLTGGPGGFTWAPPAAASFGAVNPGQTFTRTAGTAPAPPQAPRASAPSFALEGSYPNPFNPQTTIRFALPEAVHVRLTVFDVTGREVRRLVDARLEAGRHSVLFDASGLPSGTYLYRIQAGAFADTGRMMLVK